MPSNPLKLYARLLEQSLLHQRALPAETIEALQNYQLSSELNSAIRSGKLSPLQQEQRRRIDQAFISAPRLDHPILAYRGAPAKAYPVEKPETLERAYLSTTLDRDVAGDWRNNIVELYGKPEERALYRISAPKGTPFIVPGNLAEDWYTKQQEIIFPRRGTLSTPPSGGFKLRDPDAFEEYMIYNDTPIDKEYSSPLRLLRDTLNTKP